MIYLRTVLKEMKGLAGQGILRFLFVCCFNMNVAPFFTKWLRDLKAEETGKGVPYVVPHVLGSTDFSSAAWGDAAVICPWTLYLCFGDKRIKKSNMTV